ncbi:uncharacterized protein [Temnothorax nylanderi]
MLLSEDLSWQSLAKNSAVENSKAGQSTPTTSISGGHDDQITSSHPVEVLGSNIWKIFPRRLTECCNNGQRALEVDRRTMVAGIAEYMTQDLKDYSRRTAERIAKIITEKYPKTFSDVINNKTVGSGMESLRQQIYNAVNYRKGIDKETKRRAEIRLSEETADDPAPALPKPRKQDEYGCTEYEPLLPPTESTTSQTNKKLQLIQFFKSDEKDEKKISQLMDDTYPTQRVDINKKTRDLVQLLQVWPYLQSPKYLIDHASRLLGKSVQATWEESLTMYAKPIRKYIIFSEKSKMIKLRQSNSISETKPNESKIDILQIISDAKASSTATQSEVALIAVIFPLIATQLKEDPQYLFRVIPEDVESTEIADYAKQDSPIMIVRGKSLFDIEAKCDVVLEEKVVLCARGVLDGFLITFLAYYVFGYVYLPEVQKTLEFIQRVLLQINPKTGHKRKENKKRNALSYDSSVMKLANAVEAFKD